MPLARPLLLAVLLAAGCANARARAGAEEFRGEVVGVADGDTITVMREGRATKIRLQAVDAPEKDQPFGARAKQLTSSLVFGKQVVVRAVTADRYGRTVGWVYLPGGACLNEALLEAGLAWHYKQYDKSRRLADLEARARAARRGLWADAAPVAPWEWRRAQGRGRKPAGAPPPSTPAAGQVCRADQDCVILPNLCSPCPPCRPRFMRVGTRAAADEIKRRAASGRCPKRHCRRCVKPGWWFPTRPRCSEGKCVAVPG